MAYNKNTSTRLQPYRYMHTYEHTHARSPKHKGDGHTHDVRAVLAREAKEPLPPALLAATGVRGLVGGQPRRCDQGAALAAHVRRRHVRARQQPVCVCVCI